MSTLQEPITDIPSKLMQEFIAAGLLGLPSKPSTCAVLSQYFKYYNGEIRRLTFEPPDERQTANLAIRTHKDVVNTVEILHSGGNETKTQIRRRLERIFPAADVLGLDRAIDVALRLWLMINFLEPEFKSSSMLHRPCIQWDDNSTLSDFLGGLFPAPRWEVTPREGRYDPHFTVAFMVKMCGLQVQWTTSLEDHLRLDRSVGSRTLWVFPFKSYLENLRCNKECPIFNQIWNKHLIPKDILKEAVDTLLLLFPTWDEDTSAFLMHEQKDFLKEEPFSSSRPLGILDFHFWRDRLLELHQEVFLSQAVGWRQLLYDRRYPQQWLTFWLALAIAALTLIATVCAALSTIFAAVQIWGSGKPDSVCCCDCAA